jgi:hypothetical protein
MKVTQANLNEHKQTHDKTNSFWLNDAKGIPVSRVCDDCIQTVKSNYHPEVFGEGRYEDVVEEPIESDDWDNYDYGCE